MLSFKLITPSLLEVREDVFGFRDTKTSYWYYDLDKWMVSSHGQKGDTPNRQMTPLSISWVKAHYLPKVRDQFEKQE